MRHISNKFIICFAFGIVLLSGMLTVTIVASKKPANCEKYVTAVYIESGDSLWTIAERFYTEQNSSMKDYIREIKECNHLSSNQIRQGQYLIIPYYSVRR